MKDDDYTIETTTTLDGTTISVKVPNHPNMDDLSISVGGTMDTSVYNSSYDWLTIDDSFDISGITLNNPVEFEDEMPSVAKVEDMCKDYPALEKAYENFKTVYKLVQQDWQGRQDDDDLPHY